MLLFPLLTRQLLFQMRGGVEEDEKVEKVEKIEQPFLLSNDRDTHREPGSKSIPFLYFWHRS
jgi:hypothetical protein